MACFRQAKTSMGIIGLYTALVYFNTGIIEQAFLLFCIYLTKLT